MAVLVSSPQPTQRNWVNQAGDSWPQRAAKQKYGFYSEMIQIYKTQKTNINKLFQFTVKLTDIFVTIKKINK